MNWLKIALAVGVGMAILVAIYFAPPFLSNLYYGISTAPAAAMSEVQETVYETKAAVNEAKAVVNGVTNQVSGAAGAVSGAAGMVSGMMGGSVDMEAAKAVALRHAGYTEQQVMMTKVGMDDERGMMVAEIEFAAEGKKYEYKVAPEGKILSYDCEVKDWSLLSGPGQVSAEEAKSIALNHAKAASVDPASVMVRQEYDDGMQMYKIYFNANNGRYEYDVCANGNIKEYKGYMM